MPHTKANATPVKHFNRNDGTYLDKENLLGVIESFVGPVAYIASLWVVAYYYLGHIESAILLLTILVFPLVYPDKTSLGKSFYAGIINLIFNYVFTATILLSTGLLTGYITAIDKSVLYAWALFAPVTNIGIYVLLRSSVQSLLKIHGPKRRGIIIGMNAQGIALAKKIEKSLYSRIEIIGFLDNRQQHRDTLESPYQLIGEMNNLANIVKVNHVQVIYLSLPMASQPRIHQILDTLKDTTASVYFVPDMLMTDLIQGHSSLVCGMPVISVCETPFKSTDGITKTIFDYIFSFAILIFISPILLLIAMAIKIESKGPVIFMQHRYGLDGDEILIYKFRSMTVMENTGDIKQASQNDIRITKLGKLLRKTSLDELPQFINVLQGRMSIIGPRPHAVSHNEHYRKLIKGYMVRHKVKPGITGWAQVNGFRGETDTLDKMQGRIDYDLDYLRNWSLKLDILIILKTIRLVIKDQKAY